MKESLIYSSPMVSVLETRVEQGFATSDTVYGKSGAAGQDAVFLLFDGEDL